MTIYRINTECGLLDIDAADLDAAKDAYQNERHYDFADAGPGSWWIISEGGVIVEQVTIDD